MQKGMIYVKDRDVTYDRVRVENRARMSDFTPPIPMGATQTSNFCAFDHIGGQT